MSPATARTHVSRAMTKLGATGPRPARRLCLRNRFGTAGLAGLTPTRDAGRRSTSPSRYGGAPAAVVVSFIKRQGAPSELEVSMPDVPDPKARDDEPDVRFTYANERTFLAWNRTALALIATGVAATQLLPRLSVSGGRRLLGLPLIALGAVVAAESYRHWRANQRAMKRGEPLPASSMPIVLTVGIVVVGLMAVVVSAFGEG